MEKERRKKEKKETHAAALGNYALGYVGVGKVMGGFLEGERGEGGREGAKRLHAA